MKLAEKLLQLHETLIIVNKGKKNGQIIFLAGGAGSGKGFTLETMIDASSYKIFDVDEMKKRIINLAKFRKTAKLLRDNGDIDKYADSVNTIKNKDAFKKRVMSAPEPTKDDMWLADIDLSKPDNVFKLHTYLADSGLLDSQMASFMKSVENSKGLPNLIFDVTLKDIKKFNEYSESFKKLGYKEEDMHIIWVLTDYSVAVQNNLDPKRGRVVPSDILFQTHDGASKTMSEIISGKIPKNLGGEVYIVLNDRVAIEYQEDDNKEVVVKKSPMSGKEFVVVRDFPYVKIKEAGKKVISDKKIIDKVKKWAFKAVPKKNKNLFK